jgi:hypothetical protein
MAEHSAQEYMAVILMVGLFILPSLFLSALSAPIFNSVNASTANPDLGSIFNTSTPSFTTITYYNETTSIPQSKNLVNDVGPYSTSDFGSFISDLPASNPPQNFKLTYSKVFASVLFNSSENISSYARLIQDPNNFLIKRWPVVLDRNGNTFYITDLNGNSNSDWNSSTNLYTRFFSEGIGGYHIYNLSFQNLTGSGQDCLKVYGQLSDISVNYSGNFSSCLLKPYYFPKNLTSYIIYKSDGNTVIDYVNMTLNSSS